MTTRQDKQAVKAAKTAAIFTGTLAACMVSLAFSSCTAKRARAHTAPPAVSINTVSDGQSQTPRHHTSQTAAIPADWTENPLAAVVYEPVSESGAGHE
ncbi:MULTISPECIES: hypothetical protein [unclassified Neisseria]|uniref:hypothetical protein n=1 Tax=unclassified Neisseria TaxID=2623750 RepID=UPI00266582D5|nr:MULTISPECIES: hypothetical protein [unclassified Neisseria]MDO1510388.1 hypothetical protein [Neisseria sp. MVDL19-042950]MDO1516557.1 hypothetical protein [Neisseria sp. MVDL18-041461]MDO1563650.1 hypothetical protein [Neisseria sp. MVDL20-010259]